MTTGTITNAFNVNGVITVSRAQYDNTRNVIVVIFTCTPAQGVPQNFQQTITGQDVVNLGPAWSDANLVAWLVAKFGLVQT